MSVALQLTVISPYHIQSMHKMRPIATNGVAWSVGHSWEPCKNDLTDRDAVWLGDLGRFKEPYIIWGRHPPREGAILEDVRTTEYHCKA